VFDINGDFGVFAG